MTIVPIRSRTWLHAKMTGEHVPPRILVSVIEGFWKSRGYSKVLVGLDSNGFVTSNIKNGYPPK